MILELNGTKVTIVDKTLGYQGDNLVNTIQVTVDKDSTWNYKLDMYKGKSKCFDSVLMVREGNICTVQLTNEILSYGGRYVFQLRGYTDTQTYHSDIFESWVNTSIEYQDDCKQGDCKCDCKLPTEFYQVEDNVTEINNHPPYPGDNNKWMIWDVDKHEYVESDIEVIAGGEDYQTKDNLTTSITAESTDEQYPSAKATYEYGQSIAESAGKIDAITVNGTTQTVEDKTAKIIVNKSTVGLGNVNNTSDNDKPVSSAQASAIADAKQAGTTAQANLDAHISNKENPHEVTKSQVGLGNVNNTSDANKPISTATQTALNGKLDKTAVVDVTVEATKGQAADAKSVYEAIQAAKPDIVTPTAESTATQAASAKAVWDMLGDGGSGTDISLGVTGASVGDIIKVKAVDENGKPTAWEAAEIDAFDVHYKANITEALTEGFSITSVNDTPLQLKEMIAMVKLQNGSSDRQWLGCFVLTDNTSVKFAGVSSAGGGVFTDSGEYSYFVYHAKMIPNSQRLLLQTQAAKGSTTSNIIQSTQGHWLNNWLDENPVNYITGISCANNLGVGTSQGYGTEIEIWGKSI